MPRAAVRQAGAALLTAMVIVTLIATLAASMVWQQWRAVQVEAAERARAQSQWILGGAVDWARLILREDARSGRPTAFGEPWSTPLAEAKLSTFLAADRDNTDDAPDAFLSGRITDMQSRYNLRNLVGGGPDAEAEARTLRRLFELAGARPEAADALALQLRAAAPPEPGASAPVDANAPLMPARIGQLGWLGVDADTLARIAPFVTLLPVRTPVNVNTAPREVLAAAIDGLDLASAERLVQARQSAPFRDLAQVAALLPQGGPLDPQRLGVASKFFEVRGRLRLQERAVEERVLIERRNLEMVPLQRERVTAFDPGGG
jgi:general secretion pathway protein K